MKIMRSRITAIILSLVMAITCFAGCGDSSSSSGSTSGDASSSGGTTSSADDQTTTTTTYTFDYEGAYAAFEPDTLVMTVNGKEVYWDEYFGWIYAIVSELESYMGTAFGWDDAFTDSYSFESYVQYYAEAMAGQYSIIYNKALELGLELSDEQLQVIDDAYANDAASYSNGDLEAFAQYLEDTYMSKDYYYYINTVATFYQSIYESIYGEKGANFSDEEVADFIEENDYMYAKHILFMTVDSSTGEELDDETKAQKKAAAEDALAQLSAITDTTELLEKFDELMNSLSEDTGLISYPNGYYFTSGEMVEAFENATKALEYNMISEIVESPYGYHIILRLPIDPDETYDGTNTFRYMASTYAYDEIAQGWFNEADIQFAEGFGELDFDQIFSLKEVEA